MARENQTEHVWIESKGGYLGNALGMGAVFALIIFQGGKDPSTTEKGIFILALVMVALNLCIYVDGWKTYKIVGTKYEERRKETVVEWQKL